MGEVMDVPAVALRDSVEIPNPALRDVEESRKELVLDSSGLVSFRKLFDSSAFSFEANLKAHKKRISEWENRENKEWRESRRKRRKRERRKRKKRGD